jgi:hypothetical protein
MGPSLTVPPIRRIKAISRLPDLGLSLHCRLLHLDLVGRAAGGSAGAVYMLVLRVKRIDQMHVAFGLQRLN